MLLAPKSLSTLGHQLKTRSLQYLLQYVTPLDPWNSGFRLREIFSETRMKPRISRDLAYNMSVMGFRGSPVRIRPSRLRLRSKISFVVGPLVIAESQAGRPDSAGSRSEHASGAEGGRQNRRFEPSVGQALDRSRCPPRDERRTPKAPELNPAVAISSIRQSLSTSSAGTACLAFEDVRQQLRDLALEIHALRETSGGRRRRPELNPGGATVRRSGGNDLQKRENPEIGSPVCVVCL